VPCWSCKSVFLHKLALNIKPHFYWHNVAWWWKVCDLFPHSCTCRHTLWWEEDDSLVFCWHMRYQCWSLVTPNIEEQTPLCFPMRNKAGISGSLFLSLPSSVTFLLRRRFAISRLVKKWSAVTLLPVPYMWQTMPLSIRRSCFFSLVQSVLPGVHLHVVDIKILCNSRNPYFDPILYRLWFYKGIELTFISKCY
jgi:hypothetical protein